MLVLKTIRLVCSLEEYAKIPEGKVLINTINAFSYNNAQKDELFAEALRNGDYLIPDGISVVKACRWLGAKSQPTERIAGWDMFRHEMDRLETKGKSEGTTPTVMFMGSSERTLSLIREKAKTVYPHLKIVTYSPPYKPEFTDEDNRAIVKAINEASPDQLWIGMTAPKQEKWLYQHWHELDIHCHAGTIGAVFDFFAGTTARAPEFWQKSGMEWLYRLLMEPKRMWKRYVIGNPEFALRILMEKIRY